MHKKIALFAPTLLAVLVAFIIAVWWEYYSSYIIIYDAVTKKQTLVANNIGQSLADALTIAQRNAVLLERSPLVIDTLTDYQKPDFKLSPRLSRYFAQFHHEIGEIANITLFAHDGEALFNDAGVKVNASHREFFKWAQSGRSTVVYSNLERSCPHFICYFQPVFSQEQFIGAVHISLDLPHLAQKWLRGLPANSNYRVCIIDQQDRIVYSTAKEENDAEHKLNFEEVLHETATTLVEFNDGKADRLALTVLVPHAEVEWRVVVGIDKNAAFMPAEAFFWHTILFNVMGALIVIVIIIYTLNYLLEKIKRLDLDHRQTIINANTQLENIVATRTNELQSERQLLRTVLDMIPDVVFYKSPTNVYIACNQAFANFVGLTVEQVLGKNDFDLFTSPPGVARHFVADDQQVMHTRTVSQVEDYVTGKQGGVRCFEIIKAPCINRAEEVIGVLGIARDITLRHQLEAELQRERSLLRTIFDTIPDIIFYKSPEGVYRLCNRAFAQFFGRDISGIIGLNNDQIFAFAANSAELIKKITVEDSTVMHTRQPVTSEDNIVDAQGVNICFETVRAPCIDETGRVLGVLGISRNISKWKEIERELAVARETAVAANQAKN